MKSHLAIFKLDTGIATDLLVTDTHIEAPNWSPDGRYLLVNGDGRLFRVALDAPSLELLDTGFAEELNNDHGISPDGTQIVICDKTLTDASCIYTLPATGGRPTRITERTPSWWHGWSPDGATLVFAAVRDGVWGIYAIGAEGGDEACLVTGFDHLDGPDYTPDGKWVWFNAERDGASNLYRIPAQGGSPEPMTADETVDWFPHPSPDGRHVLYLAYPPGTIGHPFGQTVELRLMPAAGGPSRHLISLFGGQGTLNVPCWSPDGRRFAFVRYGEQG